MTAPNVVGGLANTSPGMTPTTSAANGELDATEADKVLLIASGSGLATTETVLIYTRNTTSVAGIGGGPTGTTPVYDVTGAAAKLSASLQSVQLEGGYLYVFVKSATAGACGVDYAIKPRQGS